MVRGVKLEIPVLVFGDDLESVLQWDAHVGSNSPLRVECLDRILRFVPIVPNSGGHIIIERPATLGECTLAVKMFQSRNGRERTRIDRGGITPVLQSSLRQEVFPDWIGCIYPHPIKVVAKRRGRREIKIRSEERRVGKEEKNQSKKAE